MPSRRVFFAGVISGVRREDAAPFPVLGCGTWCRRRGGCRLSRQPRPEFAQVLRRDPRILGRGREVLGGVQPAVLLEGEPAGVAGLQQLADDRLEGQVAAADGNEDPSLLDRLGEGDPAVQVLGDDRLVDVLEMGVDDAVAVAAGELQDVRAGCGQVAGVQADAHSGGPDHPIDLLGGLHHGPDVGVEGDLDVVPLRQLLDLAHARGQLVPLLSGEPGAGVVAVGAGVGREHQGVGPGGRVGLQLRGQRRDHIAAGLVQHGGVETPDRLQARRCQAVPPLGRIAWQEPVGPELGGGEAQLAHGRQHLIGAGLVAPAGHLADPPGDRCGRQLVGDDAHQLLTPWTIWSQSMTDPVTTPLREDISSTTKSAISSICPSLPIGTCALAWVTQCSSASWKRFWVASSPSVSVQPMFSPLMRMRSQRWAWAALRVAVASPALEIAYGARCGAPPYSEVEMMLTMVPGRPASRRCPMVSDMMKNGALTLTVMCWSNSSGVVSSTEPRVVSPAELTTESRRPKCSMVRCTLSRAAAMSIRSTGRYRASVPSAVSSSRTAAPFSWLRPVMATPAAPSRAAARAIPAPRPWVAPLISTTLSVSSSRSNIEVLRWEMDGGPGACRLHGGIGELEGLQPVVETGGGAGAGTRPTPGFDD